jgi:hypothetical protein
MVWLFECMKALNVSSNDDSGCDTGMVDWPVLFINSSACRPMKIVEEKDHVIKDEGLGFRTADI